MTHLIIFWEQYLEAWFVKSMINTRSFSQTAPRVRREWGQRLLWESKMFNMSRREEVVIYRLWLGHKLITQGYLFDYEDGFILRPICRWCEVELFSIRHVLLDCPVLQNVKEDILLKRRLFFLWILPYGKLYWRKCSDKEPFNIFEGDWNIWRGLNI